MTGSDQSPRRQALRIGPGGLPADEVRPSGPGAPRPASAAAQTRWLSSGIAASETHRPFRDPNKWGHAAAGVHPGSAAAPSRAAVRVVVGLIAFAIVIALAFWANSNSPLTVSGSGADASKLSVGQCLSSTGPRIVGQVDCTSAAADFAVVGISPKSSDASDCSASPSDVAVIAAGPTVLCLDYVAAVGQCLYAGKQTTEVGKADCGSADPGVLRVLAVLQNSINPSACPAHTRQTLVHRYNSQVICLGTN